MDSEDSVKQDNCPHKSKSHITNSLSDLISFGVVHGAIIASYVQNHMDKNKNKDDDEEEEEEEEDKKQNKYVKIFKLIKKTIKDVNKESANHHKNIKDISDNTSKKMEEVLKSKKNDY